MELARARLDQLFHDDALIWWVKAVLSLSVDGEDIHPIQEVLGPRGVKMTMFYTRVRNQEGRGVYSPIDHL